MFQNPTNPWNTIQCKIQHRLDLALLIRSQNLKGSSTIFLLNADMLPAVYYFNFESLFFSQLQRERQQSGHESFRMLVKELLFSVPQPLAKRRHEFVIRYEERHGTTQGA